MKRSPRTELGDFWKDGEPASVHERLGNAWWAWLIWVITLEDSASYIGDRAAHLEGPDGEVVMPLTLCVRAMLLGYAIECAFKGLWVKGGNKLVHNGKYVGIVGARDHDLCRLASVARFSATQAETDVLRRLTRFVRFAGRYPVAKTPEEMQPNDFSTIGKVDVGYFSRRDFRTAQSILNKIVSQMSGKRRRAIPRAWRERVGASVATGRTARR